MNIPIRTDPDFKPDTRRIIDLRGFFDTPKPDTETLGRQEKEKQENETKERGREKQETKAMEHWQEEEDIFDIEEPFFDDEEEAELPPSPELVVSPALKSERRRETMLETERMERKTQRPLKYKALDVFLFIFQTFLVSLIERYQTLERILRPFETKHTDKQLGYLALSLPNSVKTTDQILLYYPLLSRTQRYKLLRMRRDRLRMFQKIYEKR